MLEYPEIKTIARQSQEHLIGKTIKDAQFLYLDRKFVFSAQATKAYKLQI